MRQQPNNTLKPKGYTILYGMSERFSLAVSAKIHWKRVCHNVSSVRSYPRQPLTFAQHNCFASKVFIPLCCICAFACKHNILNRIVRTEHNKPKLMCVVHIHEHSILPGRKFETELTWICIYVCKCRFWLDMQYAQEMVINFRKVYCLSASVSGRTQRHPLGRLLLRK